MCGGEVLFATVFVEKMRVVPDVIKLFSCSTQLSMQFIQLINVKMPTTDEIIDRIRHFNIYKQYTYCT